MVRQTTFRNTFCVPDDQKGTDDENWRVGCFVFFGTTKKKHAELTFAISRFFWWNETPLLFGWI
jgi:hypothetical protein